MEPLSKGLGDWKRKYLPFLSLWEKFVHSFIHSYVSTVSGLNTWVILLHSIFTATIFGDAISHWNSCSSLLINCLPLLFLPLMGSV